MTATFCPIAVLLLCVVTVNEACSCDWGHPQGQFCGSDFVIRAKVLSQEVKGDSRVFNLRILKTFKGASRLNQTEGIHVHGSRQRSLFAKAYTERSGPACGVGLRNGTGYLLGGYITKGRLQLDSCGLIKEWSQVSVGQRVGVRHFYGRNCGCKIPPCYWNGCGKMEGCNNVLPDDCERRHSYCVKNADGTACSWRETAEYKNCTSKARNEGGQGYFRDAWKQRRYSDRVKNADGTACSWSGTAAMSKAMNLTFHFVLLCLLIFV